MKMNRVMHFQVPVEDMPGAQKFYEKVFGWQIQAPSGMEGQYHIARTGPSDENGRPSVPGSINGGLALGREEWRAWLVIGVDSIDEHVKKIKAAGGKLLTEKRPVLGMGFYAEGGDTEGNVLGLWQVLKG